MGCWHAHAPGCWPVRHAWQGPWGPWACEPDWAWDLPVAPPFPGRRGRMRAAPRTREEPEHAIERLEAYLEELREEVGHLKSRLEDLRREAEPGGPG